MVLPRVGVSIGVTLNMGNYETVRVEALFHRDVAPDESPDIVYGACVAEAEHGLEAALDGVRRSFTAAKINKSVTVQVAHAGGKPPARPARPRR